MDINVLIQGGVDVNSALSLLGDMEMYNETLQDFVSGFEEKIGQIKKYKEEQDMANYAILVHSLKSDAKYMGFTNLAEISLQHEMASKAGDVRFVISSFDALINEANKTYELVKKYLNGFKSDGVVLVENNSNFKILVVDDSDLVRNFVLRVVPNEYSVVSAQDGEEAIKLITEELSNLKGILLDLNMPKVNGFEVLDFLKNNNIFAKVPVTIITGDDSRDTVMRAFDYPIVDVLNKPFTEGSVRNVVNKMININK